MKVIGSYLASIHPIPCSLPKAPLAVSLATALSMGSMGGFANEPLTPGPEGTTDIVVIQDFAKSSETSVANISVDAANLILKADATVNSSTAVQTSDVSIAARGDESATGANRLDLTVNDASERAGNTIYLTQIGGSWLAMAINGTNNTVSIADLAGMALAPNSSTTADTFDAITLYGDRNILTLSPESRGYIANVLDVDIGSASAISTDNTVVVSYTDFAEIAVSAKSTYNATINLMQTTLAGNAGVDEEGNPYALEGSGHVTSTGDLFHTARIEITNDVAGGVYNVGQYGFDAEADILSDGNLNTLTILQNNRSAGLPKAISASIDVFGSNNTVSTIQYLPDAINAVVEVESELKITGSDNTVNILQAAVDTALGQGLSERTTNATNLDIYGADNSVKVEQLLVSVRDNYQQNRLTGHSGESGLVHGTNNLVDVFQEISGVRQANNFLALEITANNARATQTRKNGELESGVKVIQDIDSGFEGTNEANVRLSTGDSAIFLEQQLTGSANTLWGSNVAVIWVVDDRGDGVNKGNLIDVEQINTTGADLDLVLNVDGQGNNIKVSQTNVGEDGTKDNLLTLTLSDNDAILDVIVAGSGTNTFAISGTGNNLTVVGKAGASSARSDVFIDGDDNELSSTDFDFLSIAIGQKQVDGDGDVAAYANSNSVTTIGNAAVTIYSANDLNDGVTNPSSDGNSIFYQNAYADYYEDTYYRANYAINRDPNIWLEGDNNHLALFDQSETGDNNKTGYHVHIQGSGSEGGGQNNRIAGYLDSTEVIGVAGNFTTVDVDQVTVFIDGSNNTLLNDSQSTTARGFDINALDVAVDGDSNVATISAGNLDSLAVGISGLSNSVLVAGTALGDMSSSLYLDIFGDTNTVNVNLEGLADSGTAAIYIEGSNNELGFNLSGGDLRYMLLGTNFKGTLHATGSGANAGYYQGLTSVGAGRIEWGSSLGSVTMTANCEQASGACAASPSYGGSAAFDAF